MSGALEWCQDLHDSGYYGTLARAGASGCTDPLGPSREGSGDRVRRGGSWGLVARLARSADRGWGGPGGRLGALGVRPARSITTE